MVSGERVFRVAVSVTGQINIDKEKNVMKDWISVLIAALITVAAVGLFVLFVATKDCKKLTVAIAGVLSVGIIVGSVVFALPAIKRYATKFEFASNPVIFDSGDTYSIMWQPP